MTKIGKAQVLREKANHARRLADAMLDDSVRHQIKEIAEDLEQRAEEVENRR